MNDKPLYQKLITMCISKINYCSYCRAERYFTKINGYWFCNGCHMRAR